MVAEPCRWFLFVLQPDPAGGRGGVMALIRASAGARGYRANGERLGTVGLLDKLVNVLLLCQMLLETSEGTCGSAPSLLLQPGKEPSLDQGRRFRQTDVGPGKTSETWLKIWPREDERTGDKTRGLKLTKRPEALQVLVVGEQTQMVPRRSARRSAEEGKTRRKRAGTSLKVPLSQR